MSGVRFLFACGLAALSLALVVQSAGAEVRGCPRPGTKVLKRDRQVVVFRSANGRRISACSLENGAHQRIVVGEIGEKASHLWLKGRFVLAAVRVDDGGGDFMRSFQLFEPREGTAGQIDVTGRIDRVRMSSSGAAIVSERRGPRRYAVNAVGPRGGWVLQHARRRPTRLRAAGTRVGWTAVRAHAFDTLVDPVQPLLDSPDFSTHDSLRFRFRSRSGAGRYHVETMARPGAADGTCDEETLVDLPRRPAGHLFDLEAKPVEAWCRGTHVVTIWLHWGSRYDDADDELRCPRRIPCWGDAEVARFGVRFG